MLHARRVARTLSNQPWYNPHVASKHPKRPSLDVAWAYYEHVTLARHFAPGSSQASDSSFHKAEPGEKEHPTRLYPVFSTPESCLADFGVGVGVYFFTLRSLCIIMFLAGLINVPNLLYFGSDAYNAEHEAVHFRALKSSAICTDSTWVACPTCTRDQWKGFPDTYERFAQTEDGLTFTLINNCQVNITIATGAYLSLWFICISIYVLAKITKRRERILDESVQTTTDYAVEVTNPPKDARDAEEWRTFFEQFGHVTCCTVALDNEELIVALVERRELLLGLGNLQPAGVEIDPHDLGSAVATARPVPWYLKIIGYKDAETIQTQVGALNEKILSDLAEREYEVSEVFVIFETEESQQECLKQMAVLGIDAFRNNTSALPNNLVFRGKHLLWVMEPPEPSSVRWMDLDETRMVRNDDLGCSHWYQLPC